MGLVIIVDWLWSEIFLLWSASNVFWKPTISRWRGESSLEVEGNAGPADTALSRRGVSSDNSRVSKGDCNGSLGCSSELPSNSPVDNGRREELVASRNVAAGSISGDEKVVLFVDELSKKCRGSGRCTSGADEVNGGPFWVWDISVWDISVSGSLKKSEPRGCLRAFRARLRKWATVIKAKLERITLGQNTKKNHYWLKE